MKCVEYEAMGDMELKSRPPLNLNEVWWAAERASTHQHKTSVLTSTHLNALAGRQFFFKGEHLQKTGSFKAWGACNVPATLPCQLHTL
ncbi:hypothetical protein O3P69_001055 [Scylla paramamosain]|uniref:L-serine ammonia-lyase n=1 Tax=Scylla paramamosain TaxID=85552 RepID=A0AAW0UR31_SCYPA